MLDGEGPKDMVTVWGIPVPTAPDGRRRWPDAVRIMAVKRVTAGAKIRDIVAETGAHKSQVARWVREAKAAGPAATPGFVEVLAPDTGKRATVAPTIPPAKPILMAECRIRVGDAEITIPSDYPATHLAEILRAVRTAQ